MPRIAIEDNQRMNLRVTTDAKARIARAAALRHTDLTQFVTEAALREADTVIAAAEQLVLTEASYRRVVELLEHPPAPNRRLLDAAKVMPDLA